MMLNKEDILAVSDLKTADVEVPEWGGTVRVRAMSGTDREQWENSCMVVDADGNRKPNMENMRARLVALTMVGEDGQRMFTLEEVGHLANKSAAALDRVVAAAQKLNGLGADAEDEAVKNSVAGLSESSTSA